jgi:hypothetical protein
VDISGIGTETLSLQFRLPQFTGGAMRTTSASGAWYAPYVQEEALNIVATPTTVETIAVADTPVYSTTNAYNAFQIVTCAGKTWTPHAYDGMFLVSTDPANVYSASIISNTATELTLASHIAPPTLAGGATLLIVDLSAKLQIDAAVTVPTDLYTGGININTNANIGICGVDFANPVGQTTAVVLKVATATLSSLTLVRTSIGALLIGGRTNCTMNSVLAKNKLIFRDASLVKIQGVQCSDQSVVGDDGSRAALTGYDLYTVNLITNNTANITVDGLCVTGTAQIKGNSRFESTDTYINALSVDSYTISILHNINLIYATISAGVLSYVEINDVVYIPSAILDISWPSRSYTSDTVPAPVIGWHRRVISVKDPGVAEVLYYCRQKADDTYEWVAIPIL